MDTPVVTILESLVHREHLLHKTEIVGPWIVLLSKAYFSRRVYVEVLLSHHVPEFVENGLSSVTAYL